MFFVPFPSGVRQNNRIENKYAGAALWLLMLLLLLLLLPLLLLLSVVLSFPSHLMFSMKVLFFVCQGHLEDLLVTAAQPVVACLCGRQQTFQTINEGRR